MSAPIAAMGGAVAGIIRRERQLAKIDETFASDEERKVAREIRDLILESQGGNAVVLLFCCFLGLPAAFGGAAIGEVIFGTDSTGEMIGSFAGVLLIALGFVADYYLCKRPARTELQELVRTTPVGAMIEEKVREILAS